MKFIWLIFLIPTITLAQPGYRVLDFIDPSLKSFSIGPQVGMSYYYGDLCETKDCYANQHFSTGITSTLRLNDYFFLNLNGIYYRIEGSDALSGNIKRLPRNLSFRSDNYELSLLGNFEFLNYNSFRYITRKEFPISLFSFIGIGITTNNPKTFYKGEWYQLRPLMTEQTQYSPVAVIVPFGIGVGYRFTDKITGSLNIGYRYTFTDYLDDVSTNYKDPTTFTNPISQELNYRGDEVPYGRKGSIRGNPDSNDGYLIIGLKVESKIPNIKLDFLSRGRYKKDTYGPQRTSAKRRR